MNIELQAREIQPLRQTFARVATHTGDKPASRYLEAMLGAQPSEHFHYKPTWEEGFELFDKRRTAIVMNDWYALRDPRQFYYATWTMARARQQDAMEANYQFVESRGLAGKMSDALREQARGWRRGTVALTSGDPDDPAWLFHLTFDSTAPAMASGMGTLET